MKAYGNPRWSDYETRCKQRLQKVHQKLKDVAVELDTIAKEDLEYIKKQCVDSEPVVEPVVVDPNPLFDP